MSQEFKKIMDFFAKSPEEKAEGLGEVFEESIAFFERFKHIMVSGSDEEKEEMRKNIMAMQEQIQQETERVLEETGMSEEEIQKIAQDPSQFSPDQWELIQSAQGQIHKQAEDIEKIRKDLEGGSEVAAPKKRTGKKRARQKGPWMKS